MNPLLEMSKLLIPLAENFGTSFAVTFKPEAEFGVAVDVIVFVDVCHGATKDVVQVGSRYIITEEDSPDPELWVEAQIRIIHEEMNRISNGADNGNDARH